MSEVINLLSGMLRGGDLSPTLLFENDNLADLRLEQRFLFFLCVNSGLDTSSQEAT